jgi:hypothetical protein
VHGRSLRGMPRAREPVVKQIAIVFILTVLAGASGAQGQQAAVTASATVVHGISTGWQDEAGVAAFGNGQPIAATGRSVGTSFLTHSSVVSRTVSVRAGSPTLMADGEVRTGRAVGDVLWSSDGKTFTPLSTEDRAVTAAAVAGEQSQPLTYRVKAGSGQEGTDRYSVQISYTITLTSM